MPKLIVTWLFWLQWTAVTSLSMAMVLPMWQSIGPWSLVAYWFLLGFSQALVLRQRLPRAFSSWFLTTSFVGVGLSILLALFVNLFFVVVISTSDIGLAPALGAVGAVYLVLAYTFLSLPFVAALGGALLGWAQWRVLRRHDPRFTSWWVLDSLLSWVIGSSLLLLLIFLLKTQLKELLSDSASSLADSAFSSRIILGLAGIGAIGGAIKAGVLAWVLSQPRRR